MSQPSPVRPLPLLVLLAFVAFISLGLPDGLLGVAWPSIRGDLRVPLESLGGLAACQTAGYLIASFLSGRVLRAVPIGVVLALSTLAAALALLGFALTPSWWLLLGFGFLAGLGGGAIDAGLNAYGARHFSARVLNWLHAFFGLGTTLGPLIVTAVLSAGAVWRWSYVVVGSLQLLLALTFFMTRQRWAQQGTAADESGGTGAPALTRQTLRQPVVWLGMLTFFFYSGVEAVTAQWSYSLMTLGRDVPPTTAGLLVSLYWGSLMVGRILFGFIASRVPLVPTLRLCLGGALLGTLLFWWDPAPVVAATGLMLIGFFLAPLFASLISLTPERVGREHADTAIGFQVASAALGAAVLTALVGVVARRGGLELIGGSVVLAALLLLALYEGFVRSRARQPGR